MNELALLLLVILAIYLLQCVSLTPSDATIFRRSFAGRWKGHASGFLLKAHSRSLGLVNPAFPGHGFVVVPALPFAVSPQGIAAGRTASEGRARQDFFSFETARGFDCREEWVRAGGRDWFRAASREQAARLAGWLAQVRRAPLQDRPALIDAELSRRLRTRPVKHRLLLYEKESAALRLFCSILLLALFLVIPMVVSLAGLRQTWPALLLFLLAAAVAISTEFASAHRRLYPADRDGRWMALLTLALSPPAAVRANDLLLKDLLVDFDPLAVSRVLCQEQEFDRICRAAARALHFPLPFEVEAGETAEHLTRAWFRQRLAGLQQAFMAGQGKDPGALLPAPAPESPQSRGYCPRCLTQFVIKEGTCSDCSIPLRALPPGAA
jgi:hypothetical protein